MKRYIKYKLLILICFCASVFNANSQQVNTMYFMDNIPYRSYLNPAFQPYSNFYLGFPVFGFTQLGVGNNSLTLKDLVYKQNNQLITFLHPAGSVDKFYNTLRPVTAIRTDLQLNLLSFGFRTGQSYWSFSLTEKVDEQLGLPKDFMRLLLYGTPNYDANTYNLKNFGFDMTAYTEAGLGYSRIINDKWSVGGKLKFLYGTANVSAKNQDLTLNANYDQWTIKGNGSVNYSGPVDLNGNSFDTFKPTDPAVTDIVKPAGVGAGIDLGFTYKPVDHLTLSAAVTDLGLIRWSNNVKNMGYQVDYKFTGIDSVNINTNFNNVADSLLSSLTGSFNDSITSSKPYNTYTTSKLNIGVEYGFCDDKLSLGLLSRTMFHNKVAYEELTASVNAKPIDWFNMSLSYSVLNGRMSNIGAGIGLRTGFINWFLTTDYIPLRYASASVGGNDVSLPYNTKGINFALGVNFVFGNRKDADKDGVVDRKDKCPETPFGVIVDKVGCPLDTDGDSVPDYLDKCPNTPVAAYGKIDQNGCPLDQDGDGVPDYMDNCPDTPKEAIGFVDEQGCSLDTDKDGVYDYLDKCANTPVIAKVDSVGCPLDTDGDGVADYLDKCPGTPKEAYGFVDETGCPFDKDLDGVPDYLDLCPNTPAEARAFVDKNGCPLDTDGDGVADYLDKCPNTPVEARGTVDQNGCPRDTDGDGVLDYLDNCPKVPGVASNHGCPEIKKEVKKLFQKALRGIQFQTGKYVIKPISFTILDQIAKVLIENPTYLIEVQGHTDNVGKPESNMTLSDNRANAVKEYLIKKGVDAARMSSHGYGDTKPVAPNKTTAGKALNRRVEFVVSFEETEIIKQ